MNNLKISRKSWTLYKSRVTFHEVFRSKVFNCWAFVLFHSYLDELLMGALGCIIWTKTSVLCYPNKVAYGVEKLNSRGNGLMNELVVCNRLLLQ